MAVSFVHEPEQKGLVVELSEAAAPGGAWDRAPLAPAVALETGETARLLARLPDLEPEAGDQVEFAVRAESLPPPLTGGTVELAFPPAPDLPVADVGAAGPLSVVRFAPDGDVPAAPHLSLTFSQPMVALTSQGEAADVLPAHLDPQPPGQWRWIGTRTVLFQPEGQFPKATNYQVTVPAGTVSATGAPLVESFSSRFSTPPVEVEARWPDGGVTDRQPVILLVFDQRVDAYAMLAHLRLLAGRAEVSVRPATEAEVQADPTARRLVAAARPGRWLAVRPVEPLPYDSQVTVEVPKGAPSAEGPRLSERDQRFTFRTYGPLKVVEQRCGWRDHCGPGERWQVRFSNDLDGEAFDLGQVRFDPPVDTTGRYVSGSWLYLDPRSRPETAYTVTVDGALRDVYGQSLGADQQVVFKVGKRDPVDPWLAGFPQQSMVLDPSGPPELSVYSVNHDKLRVRIYQVGPDDWPAFWNWQGGRGDGSAAPPPGRLAVDRVIPVSSVKDEAVETTVNLAEALTDGLGQVVVLVEPTKQPAEEWRRQRAMTWVQVTRIGLSAFVDDTSVVVWATGLADGAPLSGVDVQLWPGTAAVPTDADGLARAVLPNQPVGLLVARNGGDLALLAQSTGWWYGGSAWTRFDKPDELRWLVFDDRKMYRPEEEVRVKGWLRRYEPRRGGDVQALSTLPEAVAWTLEDSRGNDLATGTVAVDGMGGFDLAVRLPDTMNLGTAQIRMDAEGAGAVVDTLYVHAFEVQEFRRPEFEVGASVEGGPHVLGETAVATVTAAYYAGGALPGAQADWTVTATPAFYTPPNWSEYHFGRSLPWWWSDDERQADSGPWSLEGTTDATGAHHLGLHFASVSPPRPMSVTAQGRVMDVNRQAWAASTSFLVHPADVYVGVKPGRPFYQEGQAIEISGVVVDIDGNAARGREATIALVRLEWKVDKTGTWRETEAERFDCQRTSGDVPFSCTFHPEQGGRFELRARVVDAAGRPNETQTVLWVSGGKAEPKRTVEEESVTLVPDADRYQAGDVAEILVAAPFFPAEGLVTWQRSGLEQVERFRLEGPTHVVKVPITEDHVPNLTVRVDLVGSAARIGADGEALDGIPPRPAYASGTLNLPVPPLQRTLSLTVEPREAALEPGGSTVIDVRLTDARGEPVMGEVAVIVVDESVLALTGYRLPDPLGVFYTPREAGVGAFQQRAMLWLASPDALGDVGEAPGGRDNFAEGAPMDDMMPPPSPAPMRSMSMVMEPEEVMAKGGDEDAGGAAIVLRTDFSALALFAPTVQTDARGRAQVPLKVSDSLTRYRVMAIGVAGGKQFGHGESTVTARKPLMLRPSPPRFLNFGDAFELPLVVQNQTDVPQEVAVAVRGANIRFGDATSMGQRVTVPANDRVEVRFPASTWSAGRARFQAVVAGAGAQTDAASFDLPVWTPSTGEAFATYGEIDGAAGTLAGIRQPVQAPGEVWPQFGGLEITTSSTALQALTDAVIYLVDYPFGCAEQLSSRVLAVAALKDVLGAFSADGLPDEQALLASVNADLDELSRRQNSDGGFGFWRVGQPSWPYLSVHVAHALVRARAKGFTVPETTWDRSMSYLRSIESRFPPEYGPESRRVITAYALHVRHLAGDDDVRAARKVLGQVAVDQQSMETLGWLLPVLAAGGAQGEVDAVLRHVGNRVAETASSAHFVTSYGDEGYLLLHSDRRVDGILLEALIEVKPDSDLIAKVVRGLLDHRSAGRWSSTQDNAFVLLAMDRYFATFEAQTPDFVARAWLGDRFAGEHAFRGRTTERAHIVVPMRWLADGPAQQDLVLAKEGAGRMYYRLGMKYAPRSLVLEPADYGFAVQRTWEAIDDPADVRHDDDGTWHVKAGARVRVRVEMVAPGRRTHVALVDPLPAGLEIMNPELAVTGDVPKDVAAESTSRFWWWWRPWYEHENLRDERVEAFTSLLWDGVHTYTYVARATTPGTFVVPPAKAEEMYHPETFGRSGTDRMVVEP